MVKNCHAQISITSLLMMGLSWYWFDRGVVDDRDMLKDEDNEDDDKTWLLVHWVNLQLELKV